MSKISIVTAFYDIGRGDWTTSVEKNGGPLPHYLERSVDKYIDHFTRLCEIDTEIIVYTSSDIAPRLSSISPNVKVVEYDYFNIHKDLRDGIEAIQNNPEFIKKINPYQVRNPEYWSKDYVGVTSLKAFYVNDAFEKGLITNDWAAWVDFGYCRDDEHVLPVQGIDVPHLAAMDQVQALEGGLKDGGHARRVHGTPVASLLPCAARVAKALHFRLH